MEALCNRTIEIYVNLIKWRYTFLAEHKEDLDTSLKYAKGAYAGTAFPSVIEALEGCEPQVYETARRIFCEICYGDCNVSKEDKALLRRTGFHDMVDLIPAPRPSSSD